MICPNCGTQNDAARTACFNCGQALTAAQGPPAQPAQPAPPAQGAPPTQQFAQQTPPQPTQPQQPMQSAPQPPTQGMPPQPTGQMPVTQAGYGAPPPGGMPPPMYPTGGTPPPSGPKRGFPALWYGLAGFGAILVLGLILYFTVLKPKPAPVVLPPAAPASSPAAPSAPPPSAPPSTAPSEAPQPDQGGSIAVQQAFCGSISQADSSCVDPGKTQPAQAEQFAIWLAIGNAPAGTAVQVDLLEADTGQAVIDPHAWELQGTPNCTSIEGEPRECVSLTIHGGPFEPVQLEAVVSINGQPVDFGEPLILTLALGD
ncbi:MAG TPA: hypothetical protein VF660_00925 [Actinomycetota bacterium]